MKQILLTAILALFFHTIFAQTETRYFPIGTETEKSNAKKELHLAKTNKIKKMPSFDQRLLLKRTCRKKD